MLSTDAFGAGLADRLVEDGVAIDPALRTGLPTTLAVAEVDAEGAATYRFYAAGTAAPSLEPAAAVAALPDDVAMVHIGTLGLVLQPLAGALRAVVEREAGCALVMVDLNCRPAAIPDREAYRTSLEATLTHTHVVKASVEDLTWLFPDTSPAAAARGLLELGPKAVLMTDGSRGAAAVLAGGDLEVTAPAVRVVDTIGAGDAFGGAFLAWWHRRGLTHDELADAGPVGDAVAFACLVAAKTCERPGACPPTLAELGSAAFGLPAQ